MKLDLEPADLEPIVAAAVDAVLARREQLGDRIGFPEAEAAQLLGIRKHVLRDARLRGEISGRKVGRSYVYSRGAILRWLEDDST